MDQDRNCAPKTKLMTLHNKLKKYFLLLVLISPLNIPYSRINVNTI